MKATVGATSLIVFAGIKVLQIILFVDLKLINERSSGAYVLLYRNDVI
jgi:hypothetical protein